MKELAGKLERKELRMFTFLPQPPLLSVELGNTKEWIRGLRMQRRISVTS